MKKYYFLIYLKILKQTVSQYLIKYNQLSNTPTILLKEIYLTTFKQVNNNIKYFQETPFSLFKLENFSKPNFKYLNNYCFF